MDNGDCWREHINEYLKYLIDFDFEIIPHYTDKKYQKYLGEFRFPIDRES